MPKPRHSSYITRPKYRNSRYTLANHRSYVQKLRVLMLKTSRRLSALKVKIKITTGIVLLIVQKAGFWMSNHIVDPLSALMAVYLGVCMSMILPASMWLYFVSPAVAPLLPTSFPIAQLPDAATAPWMFLAALPLAVRVFAMKAYHDWKKSKEALGAKLLFACNAGISWPRSWWR